MPAKAGQLRWLERGAPHRIEVWVGQQEEFLHWRADQTLEGAVVVRSPFLEVFRERLE